MEYAVGLLLSFTSLVQNFLQFLTLGPHAIWSNRPLKSGAFTRIKEGAGMSQSHDITHTINFLINLYTYSLADLSIDLFFLTIPGCSIIYLRPTLCVPRAFLQG